MEELRMASYELWFVIGSQHLYGEEIFDEIEDHAMKMYLHFGNSDLNPVDIVYKELVTTPEDIYKICCEANVAKNCIGIMAWMHTFSPAKMWIRGLKALQKPLLQLHTQFNRDIPWDTIDMDFMNLNQSAHGDREFGFIASRMGIKRKVVVGHYKDDRVINQIGEWSRVAVAWYEWQGAKFARFGDNMRHVAVTEGDKVEAEIKFGYSVNTFGIGDLVQVIKSISEDAIDKLVEEYADSYTLTNTLLKGGELHASLREAARIEAGLEAFLEKGEFVGFTDTFEDLHGMVQLPGLAVQRLMAKGYGFAGEGDWKTAALVRAMKVMATGLQGGNSFMEDYTYHFEPDNNLVLGSHMLEICPSIAKGKPTCEIHPLGIGGKADPVRLVFNVAGGEALNASIVDMGHGFRLVLNQVTAVEPQHALPKLPVARVLWKPHPNMETGCAAWILAGGAHHTCYSQNLNIQQLTDFADIAGIECITIDNNTNITQLKKELLWNSNHFQRF